MKVVIFDTGSGGELFAEYLRNTRPSLEIETVIDKENSPYGNKTEEEIFSLTENAIINHIGNDNIIVLACNTATVVAIDKLRKKYPEQVFIGFEPMIKTASELTKTGKVIVLATNATKRAERYKLLKNRFPNITVIEPECDLWAESIDKGIISRNDIEKTLQGKLEGVDVIILACTHYVAISDEIKRIVDSSVSVIDPFEAVSKNIDNIIIEQFGKKV